MLLLFLPYFADYADFKLFEHEAYICENGRKLKKIVNSRPVNSLKKQFGDTIKYLRIIINNISMNYETAIVAFFIFVSFRIR